MITFHELGLNKKLLQAVDELGFVNPTPIQQQAIPQILESEKDLIALAQTGTGKTAAFGLPILEKLDADSRTVQAIILCPTRELCLQITKDLENFAKYLGNVAIQPVYGGADALKQINGLKKNPQIVVGTPGRTLDLIKRGALKINHINWLVLDEADEMLNMGFREDIDSILETTPSEKQVLLFSATMMKEVRRIASEYMHKPEEISIGKSNEGSSDVEHHYYMVRANDRYLALKRLADINPNVYGIVFCRTRRETKEVADALIQDGYNADALHGDLSQAQRDTVMDKFRRKQLQLLVATDVAARGIDVNELTHVINYNLPDDSEVYVHRSGRTGRAGNKGVSIVIAHSREGRKIKELEKLIGKRIEAKQVPTGKEIVEKRLFATIEKMEQIDVDYSQIEPYMETIYQKLEWMDRDELLKRFVSLEFTTFLEYYKNAKDLNVSESGNDRGGKIRGGNVQGMTRFHINIGQKQQIKVPNLIGLINEKTSKRDIEIGKIEILRNFSFFEADSAHEQLILESFKGDAEIEVQISMPEKKEGRGGERSERNDRGGERRGGYGSKGGDRRSGGGGGYKKSGSGSGSGSGNRRSGGGGDFKSKSKSGGSGSGSSFASRSKGKRTR